MLSLQYYFPSPLTRLTAVACLAVSFTVVGSTSLAAPQGQPLVDGTASKYSARPSWMFNRSTYTHAPETGARVAQYERHVAVEELPDPRRVTSGYRRTRTTLRGSDGSVDASYQVQNWANGNGGLDAEWERFHDAWRQSYLRGSYYNNNYNSRYPAVGPYRSGYGPGYGNPSYGQQPNWQPNGPPRPFPHTGYRQRPGFAE